MESVLIERTGDTGKKLHTGRSRNDQVALDMKLYTRDEVLATDELVKELMTTLLDLMIELLIESDRSIKVMYKLVFFFGKASAPEFHRLIHPFLYYIIQDSIASPGASFGSALQTKFSLVYILSCFQGDCKKNSTNSIQKVVYNLIILCYND